jgi:hypothetical protein
MIRYDIETLWGRVETHNLIEERKGDAKGI